ncbi:MAG: S49 family peptidase, partial [Pseudomonadota bacterium]
NTITGSIGVILEYPDMTELLGNLGVEMQTFRSSDVKGGPSPFRELTPQQAVEQQAMIEEAYQWFRGLVGEERGLSGAALDRVAQGQVFSGRQALELDLIDAVGGQIEAESWLATQDPDLADLPYHPLFEPEEGDSLLNLISEWAGVSRLLPPIGQSGGAGLLSVLR